MPKRTNTSKATIPQSALDDLERIVSFYTTPDQVEAVAFDLYQRIRAEVNRVSGEEEVRKELHANQALVRCLQVFVKNRDDNTARTVYATISRFNLGKMFRSSGSADRYLIPND